MNASSPVTLVSPITRRAILKAIAATGASATLAGSALPFAGVGSVVAQDGKVICNMVCESGASFARNFNPFVPNTRWASNHTIYEPLMLYNYAQGKLEPWLATEYAWSADNLTLTMPLRTDVTWSDGEKFTAADVVFTFELMQKFPALIGSASGAWNDYLDAVTAEDDATVSFTFKRVYTPALYLITNQTIVAKHTWESVEDPVTYTNEAPVGTGPFTEIPIFQSQGYEVAKNPGYWAPIAIDGLQFKAYTGNDQIGAAVVSGQIDWGGLVANPDETFVAKDPEHNHYWWPTTTNVCLFLNTTRKPFDDVRFRKAIGAALNREQMVQTALWGKSTPANATGLAESAFKDWIDPAAVDAGKDWVTLNVDLANQWLDDAGYARQGDWRTMPDGSEMKFSAIVPGGYTDWVAVLQIAITNLKEVGINVELATTSPDAWSTSIYSGDFDMSLGTGSRGATPFQFYRGTMSATTSKPVGEVATENFHRYVNKQADELLLKFAGTSDLDEQKTVARDLEAIFADEAPVVPLYGAPDWGLYTTTRITGFPNEDDPYAPLTNQGTWPTVLIVFRKLKPAT
ncbi:MAG TPA: ABC transporter substrate-binding protein [Thermomicrobiales bacterium]|nr:ABC transporter substrate-binding protein [Thermomicrobiales bacterium]